MRRIELNGAECRALADLRGLCLYGRYPTIEAWDNISGCLLTLRYLELVEGEDDSLELTPDGIVASREIVLNVEPEAAECGLCFI